MQQLLTFFLDLIFPPSPEEKIMRLVDSKTIHNLYTPSRHEGITYLSVYQKPLIAAAIKQNKFHGDKNATFILGELLATWLKARPSTTLLLPIPLSKKRQQERGYNQVQRIIDASQTTLYSQSDVLIRRIDTPPQSTLSRNERLNNIRNVFSVTDKVHELEGFSHIILIDDVVTTGATLQAARATLVPHLPRTTTIHCVAIAH